jgi:hypothetical protein
MESAKYNIITLDRIFGNHNHAMAATATAFRFSWVGSTCHMSSSVEWMFSSGQSVKVTAGTPTVPMLKSSLNTAAFEHYEPASFPSSFRAVGVADRPPSAVHRSSRGRLRPARPAASITSSSGMTAS